MASCWVIVEPPCATPRAECWRRSAPDAERIDAVMLVEAPILDGDECLRHIAGHFLQGQRFAGEIAATGERAALHVHDLDRGRTLWEFPATGSAADARQPRPPCRRRRSRATDRRPGSSMRFCQTGPACCGQGVSCARAACATSVGACLRRRARAVRRRRHADPGRRRRTPAPGVRPLLAFSPPSRNPSRAGAYKAPVPENHAKRVDLRGR